MVRYRFTLRTRAGQRIDNVSIIAGSQTHAERRLRQMYDRCEILHCHEAAIPRSFDTGGMASVIDLFVSSPPTVIGQSGQL